MPHRYITGDEESGVAASSGAYTPAVVAGDLCFLSGQSPVDSETGRLVPGGPAEQTRHTLENVFALLAASDFTPDDLVSVTILLADLSDWEQVNAAYAEAFTDRRLPARMMAQAAAMLPDGAHLEIQAVAVRSSGPA